MENKSIEIFKILDSVYPKDIEFIKKDDPFRFLCTVILSASSTDAGAEKAEERLHSVYKSAEEISNAELDSIEELIKSAGLYKAKAKSIKALSEHVRKSGGIPESIEELTKIPGIGVKTANCYLVNILKKSGVIVDVHFARVSFRLGLSRSDNPDVVYKAIKEEFDESMWARLSMILNYHGRVCCKARKPLCQTCPLRNLCPSKDSFS